MRETRYPALIVSALCLVSGLRGAQAASEPAEKSPESQPTCLIRVENLSDHEISDLRIESGDGKHAIAAANCKAKAATAFNQVPFDASDFIRVVFMGKGGTRHTADFTHPRSACDEPEYPIEVYVGFGDQIIVQVSGRSHVPDDRVGYVAPTTMHQPQLIGITARDPYFDDAQALIRYPLYDEVVFVRTGDFIGAAGTYSFPCKDHIAREIPPADFMCIESVADNSITVAGPNGTFEVKPAPDDAPVPGRPADPPPITSKLPDPAQTAAREKEGAALDAMFAGNASQSIGVANWGAAPVTHLRIEAHGKKYDWEMGPVGRAGGNGTSSVSPVREVKVDGAVHVSYTDGAGKHREATFSNVPNEDGTHMPKRDFYFDANYDVYINAYEGSMEGSKNERWLAADADGPADKPIKEPEVLAILPVRSMTGTWHAMIRYPRNDQIGTYDDGYMLGGDKRDYTAHDTADGVARYKIERIFEDHVILVRDGKRTTIPLKVASQ